MDKKERNKEYRTEKKGTACTMSLFNAMVREMLADPFMTAAPTTLLAPASAQMTRMVRMMDSMVVQVQEFENIN